MCLIPYEDLRKDMLVSIIMPVYNGMPFLKEAVDSVFKQTYKEFELIVINDGSSDGSLRFLEETKKRAKERLKIINQTNRGQVVAKNNGIKVAQGDFIAFLDSDDVWDKEKLTVQMEFFKKHPTLFLCYTEAFLIDENSKKIGYRSVNSLYKGRCFDLLIKRNNITASSVVLKRKCIDTVGKFDETLNCCENWDLWLRISKFFEIGYIKKPLTSYRIHSSHMSNKRSKMLMGRIEVIKKHCLGLSKKEYKNALLNAYIDFAKSNLWNLELEDAKNNLLEALKIKPFSFTCLKLYFKWLVKQYLTQKRKKET